MHPMLAKIGCRVCVRVLRGPSPTPFGHAWLDKYVAGMIHGRFVPDGASSCGRGCRWNAGRHQWCWCHDRFGCWQPGVCPNLPDVGGAVVSSIPIQYQPQCVNLMPLPSVKPRASRPLPLPSLAGIVAISSRHYSAYIQALPMLMVIT